MKPKLLYGVFIALAGLTAASWGWYDRGSLQSGFSERQKGVCWVGGRQKVTEKELSKLSECHVNWISQTPFGWMRDAGKPDIFTNTASEKVWWGESDKGISETTEIARRLGIKSLLKPHLWAGKSWVGDVSMSSEEDWALWFESYRKFILHYARLAEQNNIEILCIGTELKKTISHENQWRLVIAEVRKVYHGKLTYAANFHEEYEVIRFWDGLDFIGVQAYFPLTKEVAPRIEQLARAWKEPLDAIENLSRKFNKPVLFTEIGYRSTADAAIEPWRWPGADDTDKASDEAQAACYEAFFQSAWKKEWLAGVYFWKWYPHGPGRMKEVDFTPQGKPAEKIMAGYFRK